MTKILGIGGVMSAGYTLNELEAALVAALSPRHLCVTNDSEKHVGHGGYREGVITHVHVAIESNAFAGKSRVAAHRLVNDVLQVFFEKGLHAVSIDARA